MFNTNNPLGSTDYRDLSDNSEVLDQLVNGPLASYMDRLANLRKSWADIEAESAQLATDLADAANAAKGAALIGFNGSTVRAALLALAATASPTFAALTLTNGQLQFPAVQVPSANANCLDDYEEGTFTPAVTFTTPGDLAVAYALQQGSYTKIGRTVTCRITLVCSTFTHTTAAGTISITGLPFAAGFAADAAVSYQGYTDANRPMLSLNVQNGTTTAQILGSGSGQTRSTTGPTQWPTGSNPTITVTVTYRV